MLVVPSVIVSFPSESKQPAVPVAAAFVETPDESSSLYPNVDATSLAQFVVYDTFSVVVPLLHELFT